MALDNYDETTLQELQEYILSKKLTDNPLMKASKVKSKNKALDTNYKFIVQAINEIFEKNKQVETFTTNTIEYYNTELIGDAQNDPSVREKLTNIAPTIIDALVALHTDLNELLQFILDDYEDMFHVTTPQTEFHLTHTPIGKIQMYVNGQRQFKSCFTYDSETNTVTWIFTEENGGFDLSDSEIVFEYDYNRALETNNEETNPTDSTTDNTTENSEEPDA